MIKRAITLLLLALPFYLAAVQQAEGRSPGPMLEVFTGGATFYSDSFHGKKTANGERYNKNEFTAAHRSLPLGTIVRVTNLSNGNKLKTLSSASSSKLTKQTSRNRSGELKILSERLPNGRTQYFVGQGPFTRYRDAQHALSKARARHTEASVACLPTLVAENTR